SISRRAGASAYFLTTLESRRVGSRQTSRKSLACVARRPKSSLLTSSKNSPRLEFIGQVVAKCSRRYRPCQRMQSLHQGRRWCVQVLIAYAVNAGGLCCRRLLPL